MTDRELLELAAKAAGMKILGWLDGVPDVGCSRNIVWWNPLVDDGDALRMAVKLRVDVTFNDMYVMAFAPDGAQGHSEPYHVDDPSAATRRAIVRAAASMVRGES